MGVSLSSVRSVSVDGRGTREEHLLMRISCSRVGDRTSSTSRRLNKRTLRRSLALTVHLNLVAGRAFRCLDFWLFCDFCLRTLEMEAVLAGDFSGDFNGGIALLLLGFSGAGLKVVSGSTTGARA